jgi:PAS domain S-box-containing protein
MSRSWPLWPTVFIFLACSMWLGLQGWVVWRAYLTQVQETETALVNLAGSLAQHMEDVVDITDTAILGVVGRLETAGVTPTVLGNISRTLTQQITARPCYRDIIILDSDGNRLASSLSGEGGNLSDQVYFRHFRDDAGGRSTIDTSFAAQPFIGPPVQNPVDQNWSISVSRPYRNAEGGFGGVVVATIELAYFASHFATYDLGPGSSFTLVNTDGTLLARHPSHEQFVSRNVSNSHVFSELRKRPFGHYVANALTDGKRRISAYYSSNRYPLLVVAAMAEDHALSSWFSDMRIQMVLAVVLAAAGALLGLHLIRQLQRSHLAEEALRKSEEFLDRTGRLAGVGGWEFDLVSNEVYWSAETRRIHGVAPDYKPTLDEAIAFYAPEARPVIAAALERCQQNGDGWDLELPFVRADGRPIWVRAVGTVIFANGKPVMARGAFQDVTNRVLEREALKIANERAALAAESGGIGIWDWDVANNRMVWDTQMYQLYGMQPRDDVGTVELWQRHLHPDDRTAAQQAVQAGLDGTKRFDSEFRVVWDDGSVHHIRGCGRTTRDATGKAIRMVGANWDITGQRIQEQQRAIIIEAAPIGMIITDEAGVITLANSRAERIFGYADGTLAGHSVEDLVPNEFRATHGALRMGFTGEGGAWETDARRQMFGRRQDGSPVAVEVMLNPVKTPNGTIVIASLNDITERLRLASEQQETERRERQQIETANANLDHLSRHLAKARDRAEQANRAKTRFLAGMSHELRTPLNGILGYAQLLHLDGGLNPTQALRVDAMLAAGKHLLQMITCVLDLSEIESEHVELQAVAFDILAVTEACVDLVRPAAEAKAKELALSITVAPGMRRRMVADPTRLRQVLLNLLGNAVKFTDQGEVTVRLRASADDAALRIEVADTGVGIPAEQRERLFQDFERLDTDATRTAEGAGLGLALSARLAAIMGGSLGHEDNTGGGSVFWLEVPWEADVNAARTAAPAVDDPEPADQSAPPDSRSLRVLVVDDVAINRDIACSFLRAAGHDVALAEGGAQAVAAVADADFDVVLMDVRMPEVDGLEATRRIRLLEGGRGQVPIVALTAQAFTDQVETCRKAGMDCHLSKPFEMDALLAMVLQAAKIKRQPSAETAAAAPAAPPAAAMPPVLDLGVFQRTAAFLAPDAFASYLQTIAERGELLLRKLREPDALERNGEELADMVHSLAGSAGMLGFARVTDIGRRFEQAILSKSAVAQALADELNAAIDATCQEIYGRQPMKV